jgi:hypothetical protein
MMHFQDIPDLEAPEFASLTDYEVVAPLVAAARIFDTMAVFAPDLSAKDRSDLNWQAMVAYAMYGNFPSAGAVISRIAELEPLSPVRSAIAATCVPRPLVSDC